MSTPVLTRFFDWMPVLQSVGCVLTTCFLLWGGGQKMTSVQSFKQFWWMVLGLPIALCANKFVEGMSRSTKKDLVRMKAQMYNYKSA